ncbi:hypothetical protein [Nocardia sp. NPDC004860]|uniref:hypothetical protein n=1 Tax=Nocardia sp. NPDC004860 TaxID=3154557 RepID=UPI0033ABE8B6
MPVDTASGCNGKEEIVLGHTHYADLFSEFPWVKLGAVVPDPPPPVPVDTRLASTPFDALMQLRAILAATSSERAPSTGWTIVASCG